ncbi:MAG: hypothetical protein Q7V20_13275 [Aquabacterium sp.]|uniref:hypothetical protein n=1 Tax=Aquabacterium sp. TaxID=1872578 RepID=UPI00271E518F|nr:hypothetical protein [Aquabacterium sp.]MDO9004417.1 hypothetical protein [Aquabacterium sp.]
MKSSSEQRHALRDEFESNKATRDASKSRKGWYATRKAQLQAEAAFAEIEDEVGLTYRRRPSAPERHLPAAQR